MPFRNSKISYTRGVVYVLLVDNYKVLYTINEEEHLVYILRVIYSARDINQLFE